MPSGNSPVGARSGYLIRLHEDPAGDLPIGPIEKDWFLKNIAPLTGEKNYLY
jgi:hypothetical protein